MPHDPDVKEGVPAHPPVVPRYASPPIISHEDFTQEPVGPVGPPPTGGNGSGGDDGDHGPGGGSGVTAQLASPYSFEFRETEKHREGTRRWLAFGMVLLLGAVAMLSLAAVAFGLQPSEDIKSIADIVFPPIVALTGSALGFFFGVERGSSQ